MSLTTTTTLTLKNQTLKKNLRGNSNFTIKEVKTNVTEESDSHKTIYWWCILSSIAIINILLWCYTYHSLMMNDTIMNETLTISSIEYYQRYHLMLSGIYVFVCAYRSVLPRIDLERYCLFDTFLSSVFLGRTAATIAEISFSAQIALFLYQISTIHNHPYSKMLSLAIVPLITIAQMFCWCGVVTLNHIYHAIEESIWAICSMLLGISLLTFAIHHPQNKHLVLFGIASFIASILFFIFMVTVDVPMYVNRWRLYNDNLGKKCNNKHILHRGASSIDGCKDALKRRVVTKSWKVWKEETMWLTGYFSFAVWLSLMLVHMPTIV